MRRKNSRQYYSVRKKAIVAFELLFGVVGEDYHFSSKRLLCAVTSSLNCCVIVTIMLPWQLGVGLRRVCRLRIDSVALSRELLLSYFNSTRYYLVSVAVFSRGLLLLGQVFSVLLSFVSYGAGAAESYRTSCLSL